MAKRKKRKPKGRKPAVPLTDPELIVRMAEEQLAAGNPSGPGKDSGGSSNLIPTSYRSRYIEVTLMVVEDRLSHGRAKEAQQLLAHLEESGAEPSQLRPFLLKVASALGESGAATEAATELLESHDAAERIAAKCASSLAMGPPTFIVTLDNSAGGAAIEVTLPANIPSTIQAWKRLGSLLSAIGRLIKRVFGLSECGKRLPLSGRPSKRRG